MLSNPLLSADSSSAAMGAPHSLSELSTSRQFSPFYDELKPILYIMRVLGLWSTPDATALTRVVFPALLCIVFLIGPWAALFIHLIDSDISRTGVFSGTFEIPLMMLNIVATATFFFVRRYLDGHHLSELIVCTFHHNNNAEHVLSAPPSPSYRSLPLQSVPQHSSDDATERTGSDLQFATLANFRARAQLEIRAWIVFELLALASFIPFSVYHTNDSPSIVLVVYQTCQRMYTFSIYSIYMRLFSLICSCHCLDVEEHIARYQLAIQSKLFAPAIAFNLVEPDTLTIRIKMLCDAVEQFFNDLMSDYIRIGKISRGTSNNFRAFVGLSLLVSFVEAIISVYLYVSTSSDPNSSQTWLDFWLLIPCLLHFLISSAALYSAAKVNHLQFNISRLGSELGCQLKYTLSHIVVTPTGMLLGHASNAFEALSSFNMIYFQNINTSLGTLIHNRQIGISLWGQTLNRTFFLSLVSPVVACVFFISQRYLTVYASANPTTTPTP